MNWVFWAGIFIILGIVWALLSKGFKKTGADVQNVVENVKNNIYDEKEKDENE